MNHNRTIPAITLTEGVNNYLIASFNDRRKWFVNYLNAAMWVWRDLTKETIWQVKHREVEVIKTDGEFFIPQPEDMQRFLGISVVDDCGNIQSLVEDDYWNVLPVSTKSKCKVHGAEGCAGGLCDTIDSVSVRIKDVIIDSQVYTEKVWTRRCENGDLLEIREGWTKDYATDSTFTVVPYNTEKLICKLDVTDCGCVKPTEQNKTLIITHCGCFLSSCVSKRCGTTLPKSDSFYGRIKIQDGKIYVDTDADFVTISYQTNGECSGQEILVPEIAVDALMFGIDFRTKMFNPKIGLSERREARIGYQNAKDELWSFNNPVRTEEMIETGWSIPKWGSARQYIHSYSTFRYGYL